MKKLFLLTLASMAIFIACKKDKEEAPSLKGKWTINNIVLKEYLNGTLSNTDTEPGDGTTLDFQDNGHVVVTHPGNVIESLTYSIQPDSKVIIDGDLMEIRDLTSLSVILFMRQDYGGGDYDDVYLNLKR
jgi:hypothetical protein